MVMTLARATAVIQSAPGVGAHITVTGSGATGYGFDSLQHLKLSERNLWKWNGHELGSFLAAHSVMFVVGAKADRFATIRAPEATRTTLVGVERSIIRIAHRKSRDLDGRKEEAIRILSVQLKKARHNLTRTFASILSICCLQRGSLYRMCQYVDHHQIVIKQPRKPDRIVIKMCIRDRLRLANSSCSRLT